VRFSFVAFALIASSGCYTRPAVPVDKPLPCTGTAAGECPVGFACVTSLCAPTACTVDDECPGELICNKSRGCGIFTITDGGAGLEVGSITPGLPFDGGGVPPGIFDAAAFDSSVGRDGGGVP
jgi:hypothetical protein